MGIQNGSLCFKDNQEMTSDRLGNRFGEMELFCIRSVMVAQTCKILKTLERMH